MPRWTNEELSILREHSKNFTPSQLQNKYFLNRTAKAVRQKLNREDLPYKGKRNIRAWSDEEISLLKEKAPCCTIKELKKSFFPKRTRKSIRSFCRKNNILYLKEGIVLWSDEDVEFLIKNAPLYTLEEFSEKFFEDRTEIAIYHKANELGVSFKKEEIFWTEEEISILKEFGPGATLDELGRDYLPTRTRTAIQKKCYALGIDFVVDRENPFWSQEEKDCLRAFYHKKTAFEIHEEYLPNRGVGAIRDAAFRMGFSEPLEMEQDPWSPEEITYLFLNYENKTDAEIAEKLNRTEGSIRNKRSSLGLRKLQLSEPKKWTEEEEFYLTREVGNKSVEYLSSKLDRTEGSIRSKARKLGLRLTLDLFSWKDIESLFNCEQKLVTYKLFSQWSEKGLKLTSSEAETAWVRFSKSQLKNFLKKRPEAVNIYEVPESSLELLDIDLEKWPEPPVYKIITCPGSGHPHVELHKPRKNYVLLYESYIRCHTCGRSLSYWATNGYSNELPEGY